MQLSMLWQLICRKSLTPAGREPEEYRNFPPGRQLQASIDDTMRHRERTMSIKNKPLVFHLHWSWTVILVLLSACAASSPAGGTATATETYVPTLTRTPTQPATETTTPVPPSRWAMIGTVGFPFPPTVDPSNGYLPELLTLVEHFSPSQISPSEQAQVYSAVIRRLAGPDDSFGGTLPKPFLFIMTATDDWWGDHTMPTAAPQSISPEVQRGILGYTADMPNEIKWVASRNEVKMDPQHYHVVDGVILTLGNIQIGDDQRLYVGGGVFYAELAAQGQTYIFEWREGKWVLVGRTNIVWVS